MSFALALLVTSLRALLITAAVCTLAMPVARRAATGSRTVLLLLAPPLLMPMLLVGYAWANLPLLLGGPAWLMNAAHGLLLTGKLLPVAVLVHHLAPRPPLDARALYLLTILPPESVLAHGWLRRAALRAVRGPGRAWLLAGAVTFLLAFQETELAALCGATSWAAWLFDAQAGGLPLLQALGPASAALLVQAPLVAAVLVVFRGQSDHAAAEPRPPRSRGHGWWLVPGAACVALAVVPLVCVAEQAASALPAVMAQGTLLRETGVSLSVAALAAAAALLLTGTRMPRAMPAALAAFGLCGPLVVGLTFAALVRAVQALGDSLLPLLAAHTVLLVPPALLLRRLLAGESRPLHLARLLAGSPDAEQRAAARGLVRRLLLRRELFLAVVLLPLSCFEVVASSLLAPAGLTPAAVRLYNLMHYGRSPVLSAMVLMLTASLLLLAVAAMLARGRLTRWSVGALVLLALGAPGCRVEPAAPAVEPLRTPAGSGFDGTRPGDERTVANLALCWCPPGQFTMGSPPDEPERRPGEDQVEVTLTRGFWMGKYEVTQEEWQLVVGRLPGELTAELPAGDYFPVGNVNFAEAEAFCRRLTKRGHEDGELPVDWEFRLPTEAQWEYACRAGTTTATAFGDRLSSRQANFRGKPFNGGEPGPSLGKAARVGSYPANAWGLHDLHGNTFEWCRDWYHAHLPGGIDPDLHDALATATRSEHGDVSRVRRGGCWADDGWPCRSAFRLRFEPERRWDHIGFRVVAARR